MPLEAEIDGDRVVAVTGVTGFIGGHLAAELVRRGWRVRALVRSMPRWQGVAASPVEVVQGGLAEPRTLEALVTGTHAIVHLAGAIKGRNRDVFEQANVQGTVAVAEAWRAHAPDAILIHLSSMAAREPGLSHYTASKRAAEERLRAIGAGARWHILRPSAVYGPGDRETLRIFRAAAGPVQPMLNGPDARLTLVHVTDLVGAISVLLSLDRASGCFDVTDARRDGYSWDEIARAAAAALGRPARPMRVPTTLIRTMALVGDALALAGSTTMLTSQKAREILHRDWRSDPDCQLPGELWQPRISLTEGFSETVAWYRRAGWLP